MHNAIHFLHETPWLTSFHSSLTHTLLGEGTCNHAVSKAVNLRAVLFFALPSLEGFNHFWYSDFQFSILGFFLRADYQCAQAWDFLITHWYSINSARPSYQSLHKMGMTLCHIWATASKSSAWQPSAFSLWTIALHILTGSCMIKKDKGPPKRRDWYLIVCRAFTSALSLQISSQRLQQMLELLPRLQGRVV